MGNQSIYGNSLPSEYIIKKQILETEKLLEKTEAWIMDNKNHSDFFIKFSERNNLVLKLKQLRQKLGKPHGPKTYHVDPKILSSSNSIDMIY